jgi:hypothetical protein
MGWGGGYRLRGDKEDFEEKIKKKQVVDAEK